jgi:hypothetical protein
MKCHFPDGLAVGVDFANDHSLSAAGACAAGAIWTGAAAGGRFGAAGFFGAAGVAATRGAGAAAGGFGAAGPGGGSAVMMLTAGVEAAVGNSALVGLPVGICVGNDATSPAAAPACACIGEFQDDA